MKFHTLALSRCELLKTSGKMLMTTKLPATSVNCSKITPKFFFFFNKKHSHDHLSLNFDHRPNNNNYNNSPSILCYSNKSSSFSISNIKVPKQTPLTAAASTEDKQWLTQEGFPTPQTPLPSFGKPCLADKAFFLLAFFACTTSVAFTSFVIAAVPTLHAMGRAAISFSKLADTAREELPSTMSAIRLSGMEISDLTLELSDLSQEIAEGVNKSAQAVQAAEAGIRHMGSRAREQTMSMIEERANLPNLSLQPVVVGAAKKTSRAVGQARKTLMNMIYRGDGSLDNENDNANAIERLEI